LDVYGQVTNDEGQCFGVKFMSGSLRQKVVSAMLAPIALFPDGLKRRLKKSSLYPVYFAVYGALGRTMGPGLYPIQGGPLKGKFISVDPSRVRAYLLGDYEPQVTRVITDYCRAGMIAFDIGGHNGYFSMLIADLVGQQGKCIAFEPMPANQTCIMQAIEKNQYLNLQMEPIALGQSDGQASFFFHDNSLMGRLGHLVPSSDREEFGRFYNVQVRSVDSYVAENHFIRLDFMKIDIEGAEFELLRGASSTLHHFRPVLLIEIHTFAPVDIHARPFLDALQQYSYQVVDIETRRPVSINDFSGGHVLAIPMDSN
jgi:FkbM family methyltransferase